MPNIIFMGTPDFAVPALTALHNTYGVKAVVTVPDKKQGRGLQTAVSAVSAEAVNLGISTILKPTSLKDPAFISAIQDLHPDIICVIAFRILPKAVYSIAKLGAFNVHASLLPKYRGAAPINHAIMNGDTVSGVTSFLLNDVVDSGTIISQLLFEIKDDTTAGELYNELKILAADCAVDTCKALLSNTAEPKKQDETLATPAPKVFRETSSIDWNMDANRVRNYILGLSPSPCAWTKWNEGVLKIFNVSHVADQEQLSFPGSYRITYNAFVVQTGNGLLSIDEIQLPGKKKMKTSDFLSGYRGPREGQFQ